MSLDPTTQSNYTDVYSTHVHLDWKVDFDNRLISGSATHTLTVEKDALNEIMYVRLILNCN